MAAVPAPMPVAPPAAPVTPYTEGKVALEVPKDTLVVIVANTSAAYYQSFSVEDGDDAVEFVGHGTNQKPMALRGENVEYLKFEPAPANRTLKLSFHYQKKENAPMLDSKVAAKRIEHVHSVKYVWIGTEDSTDNSFSDTLFTMFLFPKKST